MSDELKPCPCCSGEAKLAKKMRCNDTYTRYRIRCTVCGLSTGYRSLKQTVLDLWNTRPLCPDTLEAAAKVAENWNGDTADGDTFIIAQEIRKLKGEL